MNTKVKYYFLIILIIIFGYFLYKVFFQKEKPLLSYTPRSHILNDQNPGSPVFDNDNINRIMNHQKNNGVKTNNWGIVGDFLKEKWENLMNNQIFSGVAVGSLLTSSLIGLFYSLKSTPLKILYFLIGLITVKLEVNSISPYYINFQKWISKFNNKKLRSYQLSQNIIPETINLGTGFHIVWYKYRPIFIFKKIEYSNVIVEIVNLYILGLKPKLLNVIIEEIKGINNEVH